MRVPGGGQQKPLTRNGARIVPILHEEEIAFEERYLA